MVIAEGTRPTGKPEDLPAGPAEDQRKDDGRHRERPPIGRLLRSLRGTKTLRQVQSDTGITNAYLSNIELGLKKPGLKTLAKLGLYYQVPLEHLMRTAGHEGQAPEARANSPFDIERAYQFVLGDPAISRYDKPLETPSLEIQRFVVEMYQHWTGRKLL